MDFPKRDARQIRAAIDGAVDVTGGGQMPLVLLVAPDEEPRFREALKGRRGVKSLTLRVAKDPSEFLPMAGKVPAWEGN